MNIRNELQGVASLRGEGRRGKRRGYGVDDGGRGWYLRHVFVESMRLRQPHQRSTALIMVRMGKK